MAQWLVLRRHLPRCGHWVSATAIGWALAAGVGALLLTRFAPGVEPAGVVWTLLIGFFGGAVVGIPQRQLLRRHRPELSAWWVAISAFAWGIFFPGVVSGWFLARRLPTR